MVRKTPFGNLLELLGISVPELAKKVDEDAIKRNKSMSNLESKYGVTYSRIKLLGARNIGEYSSGQRTLPRDLKMQARIFDSMIWFFERKYDILSKENYVQLTTQFINNLSIVYPLSPELFDYSKYIKMIKSERIPDDPEDFGYFIERCCFRDFLVAFVKSWDKIKKPADNNAYYKNSLAKTANPKTAIASSETAATYIPQKLIDPEGNAVLRSSSESPDEARNDLLYLLKNKLVLVTGPGGQGKSTFLKKLVAMNNRVKTFDKVILVPLVALTSVDMAYRDNSFNIISHYIHSQNPDIRLNESKEKILLLLDGFNEYRTSKNSRAVENITGSLKELVDRIHTEGAGCNISLVVTTRNINTTVNIFPVFQHFIALSLSGTPDSEYRSIQTMCERKGIDFKGTELERIAEIPLYALLIKRLIEEGKVIDIEDRFSLFDKVYHTRAEQRIGNSADKSVYPKNDFLYFYYVILPFIAYRIVTSTDLENAYRFSGDRVYSFLSEIRQNNLDRLMFTHLRRSDRFRYIDGECPRMKAQKLMEYLDSEEDFIINDTVLGEYSFKHEQWRNYLAALFLKTNIQILQTHYMTSDDNNSIRAVTTDLNVDADISQMLRQSLLLFGSTKENAAKIKSIFKISDDFYNHIDGAIRFLYLGYEFNDYLQVDLPLGENGENKTVHEILLPLSDYLLANANNKRLIGRIGTDNELIKKTCGLLSKETEYYRRVKDYSKAFKIIALCKKLAAESAMILLHESKLFLCYYESVLLNDDILSVPEEFKGSSVDDIWKKGIRLLDAAAAQDFFFAVNLKGLLQTNPAPYLIKNGIVNAPDYCGTFCHYIRMITDSEYVRRDSAYTIYQALRLLVEYVTIDDDSAYNPYDRNSDPDMLKVSRKKNLFSPITGEKNLAMAHYLLRKCGGQALAGLNYLRGCAALASSDNYAAENFFESPLDDEWKLPYHLMLKYRCGKDCYDIDSEYNDLIEKILKYTSGRLDKTHPIFHYIEAKSTELFLLDDSQKESRRAEFDEIERVKEIDNTVKLITSYITA